MSRSNQFKFNHKNVRPIVVVANHFKEEKKTYNSETEFPPLTPVTPRQSPVQTTTPSSTWAHIASKYTPPPPKQTIAVEKPEPNALDLFDCDNDVDDEDDYYYNNKLDDKDEDDHYSYFQEEDEIGYDN